MGAWEDRVLPRLIDRALRTPDVQALRARVCADVTGDVLELGFGSGLNLPHLPPGVETLSAVEPSDLGWSLSEVRRRASQVPVERVGLDGQRLAAGDASYDVVLCTFTLCTIPDVELALAEVRRVLRPTGSFHFLEHGLAPEAGVAAWQARLEPLQRRLAGGCHLTRDIAGLVRSAGLDIRELSTEYLPGPRVSRPWTFGYLGRATPR
jgi:SAM-dependent methyltransferase